tara:strand:+ start:1801 stop:4068 length:2268 start_codon:yes stop_codon:yes gene_type:complete
MEVNYKDKYLKYKKKYLEFKKNFLGGTRVTKKKGPRPRPVRQDPKYQDPKSIHRKSNDTKPKKSDKIDPNIKYEPSEEDKEQEEYDAIHDIKFSIAGGLPYAILSAYYIDNHYDYLDISSNPKYINELKMKIEDAINKYEYISYDEKKKNLLAKLDTIKTIDDIHKEILTESSNIGDLDTKLYHSNPIEPFPSEDIQFVLVRIKFGEGGELLDMGIPFNNNNPLNRNTHSKNSDIDKMKTELLHILLLGDPNDHKYDKRIRRLFLLFFLEEFLESKKIYHKNIIDIFTEILIPKEKEILDIISTISNTTTISKTSKIQKIQDNRTNIEKINTDIVKNEEEDKKEQEEQYINDGYDEYELSKSMILPKKKEKTEIPRTTYRTHRTYAPGYPGVVPPAPQQIDTRSNPYLGYSGVLPPAPQQIDTRSNPYLGHIPPEYMQYGYMQPGYMQPVYMQPVYMQPAPPVARAPQTKPSFSGGTLENSLLINIGELSKHMSTQVYRLKELIDEFKKNGLIKHIQSARKKKVYYQIYNPNNEEQENKLNPDEHNALNNLKTQKSIQTNLHICCLAFTDDEFNSLICPHHSSNAESLVRVTSVDSVTTGGMNIDSSMPSMPNKPYRTLIMNITSILNHMNTIKEEFIKNNTEPTINFNRYSFNSKININGPNVLTATVGEKLLEYPLMNTWISRLQRLYNMHVNDAYDAYDAYDRIPLKEFSTWVAPNLKKFMEFEDKNEIIDTIEALSYSINGITLTSNSLEF